jgi:transposase
MRFVTAKTIEQLDLQALHRIRSRLIGCRTQASNQIRGLLAEYSRRVRRNCHRLGNERIVPDGRSDQPFAMSIGLLGNSGAKP